MSRFIRVLAAVAAASLTIASANAATITIAPTRIDATAVQGATTSSTLTLGNTGSGNLTWMIDEAAPGSIQRTSYLDDRSPGTMGTGTLSQNAIGVAGARGPGVSLGADVLSQMVDNTPVAQSGIACGGQSGSTSANSFWRRFYLSEHGNPASLQIASVTVGTELGPNISATVNVYSIPHSTPVDTIPTGSLTLIGSGSGSVGGTLTTTTIPVSTVLADAVGNDLVVEYHIAGAGTQWYPAANASAQTHPAFLSAGNCGLFVPTSLADTGHPDSHTIIVVNLGGGTPASCGSVSDLPWASVNPASGTIASAGTSDVAVTFNAAGLSVGVHSGLLCVASNDPVAALVEVPVSLTVTPDVFCSATLNHPIAEDAEGSYFNWETGDASDSPPAGAWHFNPYSGNGNLFFNWGSDPVNAGVSMTPGGDWLVLSDGAIIGAASPYAHASGEAFGYHFGLGGYLGFRFACAAGTCYGYAHIASSQTSSGFPATVVNYCYNTAGRPITIGGGGGGGGVARISVTPASVSTTVVPDGTTTAPLTIGNIGRADLTWTIGEAAPGGKPSGDLDDRISATASDTRGTASLNWNSNTVTTEPGPSAVPDPFTLLQMTDNAPTSGSGIACGVPGGATFANSYWRRFDLSEHGSPASIVTRSVIVGTEFGPNTLATINLYAIPHSTPVNTIPTTLLMLIGSATGTVGGDLNTMTIPVVASLADAVGNDLVVEYHIDGSPSPWFPAANATPETHPSFISAPDCNIFEPARMATAGAPNSHNVIVVELDDGSPTPATCASPGDLPWASVSPASGTLVSADAGDATVTFDATGLARGTYSGLLCVASNDPNTPLVEVPVSMRVTGGGTVPIAEVLPTAGVEFAIAQGTSDIDTVTIENIGVGTLAWSIDGVAATGGCANPGKIPWLSAAPTAGSLTGGSVDAITVTVNASGLATGVHTADLCMTTNDASHASVAVPVKLSVTPAHVDNGIVMSGVLDRGILATGAGTALNIVTSVFGDEVDLAEGGWDFNFVLRFDNFALWEVGSEGGEYVLDNDGNAPLLHAGDSVGAGNMFSTGTGGNIALAAGWLAGVDGYLGVRFNCNGRLVNSVPGPCYGYVHIRTTSGNGFPATVLDTAFDGDNRPIVIGSVVDDIILCDGFDGPTSACAAERRGVAGR
ncbi:MAG: hypothetical protein ABIR62_07265 [Dokdonella sp.]|uniref:BACON domain-containing protein n=1 Tax=Dokdonella sp. TaxID=2291710 RepID=UPI00326591E1